KLLRMYNSRWQSLTYIHTYIHTYIYKTCKYLSFSSEIKSLINTIDSCICTVQVTIHVHMHFQITRTEYYTVKPCCKQSLGTVKNHPYIRVSLINELCYMEFISSGL